MLVSDTAGFLIFILETLFKLGESFNFVFPNSNFIKFLNIHKKPNRLRSLQDCLVYILLDSFHVAIHVRVGIFMTNQRHRDIL